MRGARRLAAVTLALATLGIRAPARADAPAVPRVAAVELEVPPGEDAAALRPLLVVEVGQPLDARALRRTVQNLFEVGRFSNVVARARPSEEPGGGVVLVLQCLPMRVVATLRVVGGGPRDGPDDAAVLRSAGLEPGDELWPGRLGAVEARVRAAYARRGYRRATVTAVAEGDPRAAVELRVVEGAPTRVVALSLGRAGAVAAQLQQALGTHPGAVLDLDALEQDVRTIRALLRREGYLRARVARPVVELEGDAARVEIPVDPGRRFVFRFAGVAAFEPRELSDQLGLEAEAVLDAPALEAAGRRLQAFYVSRGYAEARVAAAEVPMTDGAVAIVFRVQEGRPYRVRSVSFPGATQRPPPALRRRLDDALLTVSPVPAGGSRDEAARLGAAVRSPATPRGPPVPDPREVWNPTAWDEAIVRVVEAYRAEGFLDAAHESTRVVLDARAGTADVEVRLREGVQTLVERVEFEGGGLAASELARTSRLAPGDPLAYAEVDATRSALLAALARSGYVYARVAETEELSPDRRRATVRFRIEEGPQVRVGRVVVSGARRTREAVIRDAVSLEAGSVYDPDAAARSQAALLRLGAFRSVALHLTEPDRPEPAKDLTVEVAERPWMTLGMGGGFSLADGPRAVVEMVQPNLFGRALELSSRGKVNYPLEAFRPDLAGKPFLDRIEGRADVGLRDPSVRLLGMQVGARVVALVERLHRPSYDLSRASAVFGLDLPASSHVTVQLQYELEVDDTQKSSAVAGYTLTVADVERLRFPQGVTTLQSVRPVIAVDFRDNPLHPRSGWMASGTVDWVHSLGNPGERYLFGLAPGSDVYTHMLKLSGSLTGYLPLSQAVFALSLRAGRVVPLDSASQTIGPKRFFLGGANTMRGYAEDALIPEDARSVYLAQVRACAGSPSGFACSPTAQQLAQGNTLISEGGEAFVLAKAELRIPLVRSVEAGVFADAGNLWIDPGLISVTDLRFNVGVGLRFSSPIGPAVLDLGFNVNPDYRLNESILAPHFSIGLF